MEEPIPDEQPPRSTATSPKATIDHIIGLLPSPESLDWVTRDP
jgi:hypothetical protein